MKDNQIINRSIQVRCILMDIPLKGYASPNIYPFFFFFFFSSEDEINHFSPTCRLRNASLRHNRGLHCLDKPLHSMLGIIWAQIENGSVTMHDFITNELFEQPMKYSVTELYWHSLYTKGEL